MKSATWMNALCQYCFLDAQQLRNTMLNNRLNCEIHSRNTNTINTSQVWTSAFACIRQSWDINSKRFALNLTHTRRSLTRKSRTLLFSTQYSGARTLPVQIFRTTNALCFIAANLTHPHILYQYPNAGAFASQNPNPQSTSSLSLSWCINALNELCVYVWKFICVYEVGSQTSGCWHHVTALEQIGRACWARSAEWYLLLFLLPPARSHY